MKKVYLGGTCNGSTWRDKLIDMLEIDYFNPVTEDWTEEDRKKEKQARQTYDFCLYTITPKMKGVYSIAELIDDTNKRPFKTILVLLEKDDEYMFSVDQRKSLEAVDKMVRENWSKVFYDLEDAAQYMNNFY